MDNTRPADLHRFSTLYEQIKRDENQQKPSHMSKTGLAANIERQLMMFSAHLTDLQILKRQHAAGNHAYAYTKIRAIEDSVVDAIVHCHSTLKATDSYQSSEMMSNEMVFEFYIKNATLIQAIEDGSREAVSVVENGGK